MLFALVAIALQVVVAAQSAATKPSTDLSARDVLKVVLQAMNDGDPRKCEGLVYSDDADAKFLDEHMKLVHVFEDLRIGAELRWGSSKHLTEALTLKTLSADDFDEKATPDGVEFTLRPSGERMLARKVKGHWKLDLLAFDSPEVKATTIYLKRTYKANLELVRNRMWEGRYDRLADMRRDVDEITRKYKEACSTRIHLSPATAPTSKPVEKKP